MKQTNDLRSRGSDSHNREQDWPATDGKIIYIRCRGRWMLYGPSSLLDSRAENLVTLRDGRTLLLKAYSVTEVATVDGVKMATAWPERRLMCSTCGVLHRRADLWSFYGTNRVRWVKEENWCDCSGLVADEEAKARAAEEARAIEDFKAGESEALAEAESLLAEWRGEEAE